MFHDEAPELKGAKPFLLWWFSLKYMSKEIPFSFSGFVHYQDAQRLAQNKLASPLYYPIGSKSKTNRDLLAHGFPGFA